MDFKETQVETIAAQQKSDSQGINEKQQQERDIEEEALFDVMARQLAWEKIQKDLNNTLSGVLDMLKVVLNQDTEEPLGDDAIKQIMGMDRILELDGESEFYEQMYATRPETAHTKGPRHITQLKRTRILVAIHACSLTVKHLGQISAACFNHMVYF